MSIYGQPSNFPASESSNAWEGHHIAVLMKSFWPWRGLYLKIIVQTRELEVVCCSCAEEGETVMSLLET